MTAGYDPYDYVRSHEDEEYDRLSRRPVCDICCERITGESCYVVGDQRYCEDCFEDAIHKLRRYLLPLVEKTYKKQTGGYIIVDLVESILDNFDFVEWESDHEEVLE